MGSGDLKICCNFKRINTFNHDIVSFTISKLRIFNEKLEVSILHFGLNLQILIALQIFSSQYIPIILSNTAGVVFKCHN